MRGQSSYTAYSSEWGFQKNLGSPFLVDCSKVLKPELVPWADLAIIGTGTTGTVVHFKLAFIVGIQLFSFWSFAFQVLTFDILCYWLFSLVSFLGEPNGIGNKVALNLFIWWNICVYCWRFQNLNVKSLTSFSELRSKMFGKLGPLFLDCVDCFFKTGMKFMKFL